ncbi:MAG: hypothetical protein JNK05_40205 [Myxococcales bacterium]|nr:hypothetical protein [Myxococcales bacterium]
MRRLLCTTSIVLTGCVDVAFAQSAPRADAGAPRDAAPAPLVAPLGDRITGTFGRGGLGPIPPSRGAPIPAPSLGSIGLIGHGGGTGSGSGVSASGAGAMGARQPPRRQFRQQIDARATPTLVAQVRRTLLVAGGRFAFCFERYAPASPNPQQLDVRFDVARNSDGSGRAINPRVAGLVAPLQECVRSQLALLRFAAPIPAAPVPVTDTMTLTPTQSTGPSP